VINFASTGLGSHPIADAKQIALDIISSGTKIPYFPQTVEDNMTFQFHNIIPGLILEKGSARLNLNDNRVVKGLEDLRGKLVLKKINIEPGGLPLEKRYIRGLYALEEALQETEADIWGVKGEITGPLTEAYSVEVLPGRKKAVLDEELFKLVLDVTAEVAYWLSKELQKLSRKFLGKGGETILFLDEPLLPLCLKDSVEPEAKVRAIESVLCRIRCKKGIHICDNPLTVIDNVLKLNIDYFSFDARRYPDTLEKTDSETLEKYLRRGKGFAFGLTPNTPEELFGEENIYDIQRGVKDPFDFIPKASDITNRMEHIVSQMESKIDVVFLLHHSLITPQCGFRNFNIPNPSVGEKIVKRLLEIQEKAAEEVREKYKIGF
jgi:hypothetical protein